MSFLLYPFSSISEKTLKNIYRTTKSSIEENGSNTLFLALGFLKWYESDISEKPRYAPVSYTHLTAIAAPIYAKLLDDC